MTYTIPGNFKMLESDWVRVFSKEPPNQRVWQQPKYHPFVAQLGLMVMEYGFIWGEFTIMAAIIMFVLNRL